MIIGEKEQTHEEVVKSEFNKVLNHTKQLSAILTAVHSKIFSSIWSNPNATAQEILNCYGTNAKDIFILSSGIQQILSKADTEYLPLTPPCEVKINEDGTVLICEENEQQTETEEQEE